MVINFKKLKSQIYPWKPESKSGYIFIPTMGQEDNFIFSIAIKGSKRNLMKHLIWAIKTDSSYQKEFKL